MYKLPQDILRLIYEYDDTYKINYNRCIDEMNFVIPFNHVIDNMNIMNFYYNDYKIYYTINNERFYNDSYNPIMKINKFTLIYVCVLSFNFIDDDDSIVTYIRNSLS